MRLSHQPITIHEKKAQYRRSNKQSQGISITPTSAVDQQPTAPTSALNEVRDTLNQISSGNLNPKRGGVTSRAPHVP
jgi:hypothetical protein